MKWSSFLALAICSVLALYDITQTRNQVTAKTHRTGKQVFGPLRNMLNMVTHSQSPVKPTMPPISSMLPASGMPGTMGMLGGMPGLTSGLMPGLTSGLTPGMNMMSALQGKSLSDILPFLIMQLLNKKIENDPEKRKKKTMKHRMKSRGHRSHKTKSHRSRSHKAKKKRRKELLMEPTEIVESMNSTVVELENT